jgi:hypothetical protein
MGPSSCELDSVCCSVVMTRGVVLSACIGDNSSALSSSTRAALGVSNCGPDRDANDKAGCILGVAGASSVDLDLRRRDCREVNVKLPIPSAIGVLVEVLPEETRFRASTETGVPLTTSAAYTMVLRTVLAPSSRTESSSGAPSSSSRTGETVPTTRLLFSIDRTVSSRSGLSSSSSPSSSPGSACVEPRFLLPRCGVAA